MVPQMDLFRGSHLSSQFLCNAPYARCPRDGAVGAPFNSPDPSHGWEILERTKHQSDGLLRIYGCFLLKKKTLFLARLVEQFLDSIDGKFRATKLHNVKHTHTLARREGTQTYGRAMHKHAQCWFQLNYMSVFTLHHSSIGMVLPFAWALPFMAFGNGRSLLMTHTHTETLKGILPRDQ